MCNIQIFADANDAPLNGTAKIQGLFLTALKIQTFWTVDAKQDAVIAPGGITMPEVPELFAAGFGACWAKLVADHPMNEAPFMLSDEEIDRAWMIYLETREDTPDA